jgi:hypothetical protein
MTGRRFSKYREEDLMVLVIIKDRHPIDTSMDYMDAQAGVIGTVSSRHTTPAMQIPGQHD